jgi:hypothetical protein
LHTVRVKEDAMPPEHDRPEAAIDAAAADAALAAVEETLHPQDRAAEEDVSAQMEGMLKRDRLMAMGFVAAMLVALPFVLIAVWNDVPSNGIRVVLVVSCAVVLVYNVASIVALVSNYRRDRDFVYRRDVAHLRERAALRAAKAER